MHLQPTILHESSNFVIVHKPAGWLTVPSRLGDGDPRICLGRVLEKLCQCRIFPVHRLDECVEGLVIFAKTAAPHRAGNLWFENSMVRKTYEALTDSLVETPAPGSDFHWVSMLAKGKKRSYLNETIGKRCETIARYHGVLKRNAEDAVVSSCHHWSLFPVTGRPHQLRCELGRHGFPIVGDALYGSTKQWIEMGIALRMCRLDFSRCPEAPQFELPECIEIQGFQSS